MTFTTYGQKLKKKKPQYFLKIQGGLLYEKYDKFEEFFDKGFNIIESGKVYTGFNIGNISIIRLRNFEMDELNIEYINYASEYKLYRPTIVNPYGKRKKIAFELEYFKSLLHLGKKKNSLYIGPTIALGYQKNETFLPYSIYYPHEIICYCFSSGIKLLYNFNLAKKINLNISSKATFFDYGFYRLRRHDPNLPKRAQYSETQSELDFWRDQYQLLIGFNIKLN